jgi:hypothetical protein
MRFALTTFCILTAACAPEAPTQMFSKGGKTGNAAIQQEASQSAGKLFELKAQNDALCERVQKQRNECPLSAVSLNADDAQNLMGCSAGSGKDSPAASDFELDIGLPANTKAVLSAKEGQWQTQAVGTGTKQKLNWAMRSKADCGAFAPRSSSQSVAPRFLELTDISLKLVSESCDDEKRTAKLSDVSSFTLNVNGSKVLDKSDLQESGNGFQVSVTKLLELQQDPRCTVPESEIKEIKEKAAKAAKAAAASAPPADLEAQIARESSRNDVLNKQLSGVGNIGCWGYAKIKKLEVKIEGAAEPLSGRGEGGALQDAGNSREFVFAFGQNLLHTINDVGQNEVFKSGGRLVIESFADREIQELRNLRIKKGGVAYQNNNICKPCFLGIGCWCGFSRHEKDIRSMSKIEIFANDQLVYQKSGIKFRFEDGQLAWPENGGAENIQNSPAFGKLMGRKDCPAE